MGMVHERIRQELRISNANLVANVIAIEHRFEVSAGIPFSRKAYRTNSDRLGWHTLVPSIKLMLWPDRHLVG